MKRLILITLLSVSTIATKAQDSTRVDTLSTFSTANITTATGTAISGYNWLSVSDTHKDPVYKKVLAYALVNKRKGIFKWVRLYGVSNKYNYTAVVIWNGVLKMYERYTMLDKKTKPPYTVVWAVDL